MAWSGPLTFTITTTSMRTIAFPLVVLLATAAQAQDWALIDPAYTYNYSLGGTDTITDQVLVTHIDTLGQDSFRFGLNPVAEICDGCGVGLNAPCYLSQDAPWVQDGRPSVMGWAVRRSGASCWLEGLDTLLLHPQAGVGSTWAGSANVTATVLDLSLATVLGEVDSVKVIGLSNGDSLLLTQHHGVAMIRTGNAASAYQLIGMQGPQVLGRRAPDLMNLFDYHPGDILEYKEQSSGTDGQCYWTTYTTDKYTITARTPTGDSVLLSVVHVYHRDSYATPIVGSGPCYFYGDNGEGIETLAVVVRPDRWTASNLFGSSWLTHCWVKALGPNDEQTYRPMYSTRLRFVPDVDGRDRVRPDTLRQSNARLFDLCRSEENDSIYGITDQGDEEYASYKVGIGLLHAHGYYFENGFMRDLYGYSIAGEEGGVIDSDGYILSVNAVASAQADPLFPNPANDRISLPPVKAITAYSITDLEGRIVLTGTLQPNADQLDVHELGPGIYVAHLDGRPPQRFVIAR